MCFAYRMGNFINESRDRGQKNNLRHGSSMQNNRRSVPCHLDCPAMHQNSRLPFQLASLCMLLKQSGYHMMRKQDSGGRRYKRNAPRGLPPVVQRLVGRQRFQRRFLGSNHGQACHMVATKLSPHYPSQRAAGCLKQIAYEKRRRIQTIAAAHSGDNRNLILKAILGNPKLGRHRIKWRRQQNRTLSKTKDPFPP